MLGATVLNQLSEVDDWPAVKGLAESSVPIHETRKLGQNDEIFQAELRRHYPDLKHDRNPKDLVLVGATGLLRLLRVFQAELRS